MQTPADDGESFQSSQKASYDLPCFPILREKPHRLIQPSIGSTEHESPHRWDFDNGQSSDTKREGRTTPIMR